jgi:phosphoglycerate dehydrogenase-like enzyme
VTVVLGQSQLTDMRAIAASTIEMTFALLLAVLRHVSAGDAGVRAGAWPQPLGHTLNGKKLGILGLGRIGREVARIAQAFGAEVLAWGPTLTAERAAASGVAFVASLDALLEQADIVSVHLALADDTRGLLDEARLRRIGPRGVLVNTARGAIVDEAALARLLAERAIAGAALDVFVVEPLPADSPLRALDNLVMTPHLGWQADRTYRYMADVTVRLIEAWLDGAPIGVINKR